MAARWRLYRSAGLAAEPVTLPDSTQEGVRFDPTEHFICGFADATPPTH